MDCHHYSTESAERKKGQHLRMEDRGAIKVLKKQGHGPSCHRQTDRLRPIHRCE